jgi:hypothetical protein
MPGLMLTDFDVIIPRNMWLKMRLPPFPPPSSVLTAPTPDMEKSISEAFDIVSLIEKKDGTRRTIDGVNRAAQHRWPERRIHVDLVYDILIAWQTAGTEGVLQLVAGGKQEGFGQLRYRNWPKNEAREMAAVLHEPKVGSEVFLSLRAMDYLRTNPNPVLDIYLVSAVAQFGRYRLSLVSVEAPEPKDVEIYCCWHTRVPDPRICSR